MSDTWEFEEEFTITGRGKVVTFMPEKNHMIVLKGESGWLMGKEFVYKSRKHRITGIETHMGCCKGVPERILGFLIKDIEDEHIISESKG